MKIKFNSHDNLPLNKPLKFHNMAIAIRSVFDEDGKLYPQAFLDDVLHEVNAWKMLEFSRTDISEGIDANKTNISKECNICHY